MRARATPRATMRNDVRAMADCKGWPGEKFGPIHSRGGGGRWHDVHMGELKPNAIASTTVTMGQTRPPFVTPRRPRTLSQHGPSSGAGGQRCGNTVLPCSDRPVVPRGTYHGTRVADIGQPLPSKHDTTKQQTGTHPRTQEHMEVQPHQHFATHTDPSCSPHQSDNPHSLLDWNRKNNRSKKDPKAGQPTSQSDRAAPQASPLVYTAREKDSKKDPKKRKHGVAVFGQGRVSRRGGWGAGSAGHGEGGSILVCSPRGHSHPPAPGLTTRSGPQRVRMSSAERPMGAAKGTQSDTEALCQPPPPHISVDTTKTRSGPQRVRMCNGERPMGAAKGTQSDTEALCPPPPPLAGGVDRPANKLHRTRCLGGGPLPSLPRPPPRRVHVARRSSPGPASRARCPMAPGAAAPSPHQSVMSRGGGGGGGVANRFESASSRS